MTPKELLYVEDALNHEKFMKTQCDDTAAKLQDAALKSFVENLGKKHAEIYKELYNTL